MTATDVFAEHRPLLFGLAYRLLGSAADAEDVLQEAWLRWEHADGVKTPRVWLATVVTRLCLDQMKSARVRRERYVGPWLPEPVVSHDLDDDVALSESVSLAFLVVLETLSPLERAVFVLREVFAYDYPEIAAMLGRGEAACRQLAHRAREHVAARRPRFPADRAVHREVTQRFMDACAGGDLDALLRLLADDVVLVSDGGGKVAAALRPVRGADRVAALLLGIVRKSPPGLTAQQVAVNGLPGTLVSSGGHPIAVTDLEIGDGLIRAVRIVVNPDKLRVGLPAPTQGGEAMSEQVPQGSGKQFGEDVADVDDVRRSDEVRQGSGKQFAEGDADVDAAQGEGIPEGSGKQFAPGVEGDPDLEPPDTGKGFATGQAQSVDPDPTWP